MHDRSHAVMRLPVHLPNQQRITFKAGREEEALLAAETGHTKLESWIELNASDEKATQWLYTDISLHYVYIQGKWKKRQCGGEKIVSRLYIVSVKDEERFCLRLLLLHVHGAPSFESLRTFNNAVHPTFKEAALSRGLLESDAEWNRCLTDAFKYDMPK